MPSSTIRVLALMEAREAAGPARNLLELARQVRHPQPGLPPIEICIATFERGRPASPNGFIAAVREAGLPLEIIAERYRFDHKVLPQLRALVDRRRPDILQTHNVKSHLLVRLLGLWRRYPWVAFRHGYTATDLKDTLYNQCDRWSLRKAYRVVAVCQCFAAKLQRAGVEASRILVQHNPARPFRAPEDDQVQRLRARLALPPDAAVVVSIGRLSREKGHAEFLPVIASVLHRHPGLPLRLLLVGDGPERAALERRCGQLGLGGHVVFAGYQGDVRPYYALAQVLALPSHTEGSPNVVLEAMAAGVPVVATAVGGVPEIITDGVTGLLVPKGDRHAMAGALSRLLLDAETRDRLAAAARQLVTTRYSPEAYERSIARLYQDVVNRFCGTRRA